MEFKKIIVNNFGGISSLETDPTAVNVLIGPNGAGKSSFLKAIKYGLIGNQTRSQLLKDGCAAGNVELQIDDYVITKEITDTGNTVFLNGKRTTQKSIVEILQDEYGASKDAMKFLTSSEVFEKATGSEFTEFLLQSGIVPLKIDVNKFLDVCREEGPVSPQIEDEIRRMFPSAPEEFDLTIIGDKGDEISGLIKAQKKEITRLEGIVSQIEAIAPGSVRDTEAIKKDYEKVVAEEANINSYRDIVSKAESITDQIKKLEAEYAANTASRPNPTLKPQKELELTRLNENIKKDVGLISSFESNNKILGDQLKRLDESKCPLSDKLICTADKSSVKAELSEQIDSNQIQIDLLKMDLEAAEDNYSKCKTAIAQLDAAEKRYADKLNIQKQINSLKAALPKIPAKITVSGDIGERKRILNEELQFSSKYHQVLKEKENLEEQKKKLELLEKLEVLCSKKGTVKAKILKMLLGTLVSSINDMAAKICPSLSLGLVIDKNGNVLIQCSTPSGTQDYGDLSTGEKLLVQFLVMAQINLLSGFKILILDNLDKLDASNFKRLLEFLLQPAVRKYFDHVFVATVDHEDFKNVLSAMPAVNTIAV